MIKGCAKRVVVVRNIDSALFEEAFFIVKSGQSAKKSTEEEFLGEAGRLVKAVPGAEQTADAFEKDKEKNESETSGERFRFSAKKNADKGDAADAFCLPSMPESLWPDSGKRGRKLCFHDVFLFALGFVTAAGGAVILHVCGLA